MAVSFDLCQGNPGAITFMLDAYGVDMNKAEFGFRRMEENKIRGPVLYVLWNDCCGRNTSMALDVMEKAPIDELKQYINGEDHRGTLLSHDVFLRWMGQ